MTGIEIDFVVKDSLVALATYEKVFPVELIEVTSLEKGNNEAIFAIFGMRFHMLDENKEYGLSAPTGGENSSMWFNVVLEDIQQTVSAMEENNFNVMQPIREIESFGVSNAFAKDPFGYVWMLHQIHKVVGFEEREQMIKDQTK